MPSDTPCKECALREEMEKLRAEMAELREVVAHMPTGTYDLARDIATALRRAGKDIGDNWRGA